ncbi:hypothetical protein THAOC_13157 [Thalassiosira oceanica]|uniref:Protein kinase domain-containing protein n=1 Tax=Thalassiosira oceanica TaxID=159749 RepID=K0T673_THAOC|nr:hypothetical protein THAOC_13157 [Thalassiosira oceanica]|eukprot:EJK65942.1 hypothetical protein THAOC_13157 [Thalassiosira oceanica]
MEGALQQTSLPNPAAVEQQHAAGRVFMSAAPLSKAPTDLAASYTTASTLCSDGDSSTASNDSNPASKQHYYAANSITGSFSDISRRFSVDRSRVLGTGEGTTVCECEDLVTGKNYAVKTVVKGHRRGATSRDLHREVSLLRDLPLGWCSGVIELIDLHEDSFNLHIVTELCRGGELFARINDRVAEHRRLRSMGIHVPRCFSEEHASTVLRQILSGLEFLHARDICHRDIKPENILFLYPEGTEGPDGEDDGLTVRIADLGLARYHRASDDEARMSTVVGTCTFIAPEVLRRRYDRRCDHWSLGIVAFVMMCGYPPFVGSTSNEVCDAVLKGRFRFDPKHWGDVSKDAKGFVRGLLKVRVNSRMGGQAAMEHRSLQEAVRGMRVEERGEGSYGGPSPVSLYGGPSPVSLSLVRNVKKKVLKS